MPCQPQVDDLLRPRPKAKEMVLTGGQQVDVLSKVVALRNQSLASEETGAWGMEGLVRGGGCIGAWMSWLEDEAWRRRRMYGA